MTIDRRLGGRFGSGFRTTGADIAFPASATSARVVCFFANPTRRNYLFQLIDHGLEAMAIHSETRTVPYSAKQMYDLVADIDSYPEFVPLCSGTQLRPAKDIDGKQIVHAEMEISFLVKRVRTESKVSLDPVARHIVVENVERPFNPLEVLTVDWRFTDLPKDCCKVQFKVDFRFKSRTMEKMFGKAFLKAYQKIVAAFEQRAAELYH